MTQIIELPIWTSHHTPVSPHDAIAILARNFEKTNLSARSLADVDERVLNRLISSLDPISEICFGLNSK